MFPYHPIPRCSPYLLVRFFLPTKLGDPFRANVEFTFQHGAFGIEKDIKASIYPALIGDFNIFEPAGSTHVNTLRRMQLF